MRSGVWRRGLRPRPGVPGMAPAGAIGMDEGLMGYEWKWQVFLQPARATQTYLDWLLAGLWTTGEMGTLAGILAFILGSLLGLMRTAPHRLLSRSATVYVEIVRNVPLIVQLFAWYYLGPKVLPDAWGGWVFG